MLLPTPLDHSARPTPPQAPLPTPTTPEADGRGGPPRRRSRLTAASAPRRSWRAPYPQGWAVYVPRTPAADQLGANHTRT